MLTTDVPTALALPGNLDVQSIEQNATTLTITAVSCQVSPRCSRCDTPAARVHSHYTRQIADLPCGGMSTRLLIQVRKYFCEDRACTQKIFTERLAPFIEPWARVTARLTQVVQALGLATSGKGGARLARRLGIVTSWMTVLRRLLALPASPVHSITHLGIDDFSFRRGRTFGTILVDLQSHRVIDVLPDRKAETARLWMANHPEIVVVSRDRGGDYATAAAKGAPQAVQCADRFHLLKNLGDALEGVLAQHLAMARKPTMATSPAAGSPAHDFPLLPVRRSPQVEYRLQQRRADRLARYEQVLALRQQGLSLAMIAQQTGQRQRTIQRWLAKGTFPERKSREQASRVDAYLPYLCQRWEAGCHHITRLFQELAAQGYTGSYASVYTKLARMLPTSMVLEGSPPTNTLMTAKQATFLFLRKAEDLDEEEQAVLTSLRHLHAEVEQAYLLVQQFIHMLHTRTGEHLDAWLDQVKHSHIRALQGFIRGVQRDHAAVLAGLTLPTSNGVVEGHVNKLKLIKRMGYGRAGFALLRQRVLHAL